MFNCFGYEFIMNSGKSNVWCLYPNKNAVVKSVQEAFGQEPVGMDEVSLAKVICFSNTMLIIVPSFVNLLAKVLIISHVEWCWMHHEAVYSILMWSNSLLFLVNSISRCQPTFCNSATYQVEYHYKVITNAKNMKLISSVWNSY